MLWSASIDPRGMKGRCPVEDVVVHVGEPLPLAEDLSSFPRESCFNDASLAIQQLISHILVVLLPEPATERVHG
jgi:hypothetical protein